MSSASAATSTMMSSSIIKVHAATMEQEKTGRAAIGIAACIMNDGSDERHDAPRGEIELGMHLLRFLFCFKSLNPWSPSPLRSYTRRQRHSLIVLRSARAPPHGCRAAARDRLGSRGMPPEMHQRIRPTCVQTDAPRLAAAAAFGETQRA